MLIIHLLLLLLYILEGCTKGIFHYHKQTWYSCISSGRSSRFFVPYLCLCVCYILFFLSLVSAWFCVFIFWSSQWKRLPYYHWPQCDFVTNALYTPMGSDYKTFTWSKNFLHSYIRNLNWVPSLPYNNAFSGLKQWIILCHFNKFMIKELLA